MSQKKGTLASIAAELGISRTTVSNAYNRPEQLSEELREKIFAVARARGYTCLLYTSDAADDAPRV